MSGLIAASTCAGAALAARRSERVAEPLVAYAIVALEPRGLLLRPFVRALEAALVETCAVFGVVADRRDGHPGCWCAAMGPRPRKIGALGIRVERGISYHGVALNVSVDLRDFDLIDPCGMPGIPSTSIAKEAGWLPLPPSTEDVDRAAEVFTPALAPTRVAPAATIAFRLSRSRTPPAAFTPMSSPTTRRISATSAAVAPPGPKPVDVFT